MNTLHRMILFVFHGNRKMDRLTAFHPFFFVFRFDITFRIAVFMQIVIGFFQFIPCGSVFFQRKIEKRTIVGFLYDLPALFQQFLILFQKISVRKPLRCIADFRQRREYSKAGTPREYSEISRF